MNWIRSNNAGIIINIFRFLWKKVKHFILHGLNYSGSEIKVYLCATF